MNTFYLVDGDNNIGTGLKGVDLLGPEDHVLIFHQKGISLTKIKKLCEKSPADIQYIESVKGGRNSIDFQIITELGVLIGRREAECAYVISQDKGYESSISVLRARYAESFREVALHASIEECLRLAFLYQPQTRRELRNVLMEECGDAHGQLLFNHLEEIFQIAPGEPEKGPEPAAEEGREDQTAEDTAETQTAAHVKPARRRYYRKKPTQKKAQS